jgi:hypothetical protein
MITERYRKNIAAGLSAIEVQISGQDKSCDTDFSMRAIQFNRVCPFNFMVYATEKKRPRAVVMVRYL